ncbi:DUF1049 domain-containing protein [Schleiferilactobacillus harbinensis]|jgi:uncharacterized integral membrane protein|uniref:DUF1049 domain-containing protein n=2 Tax=Schleiferilactobacillus harbinensis TaxID=304207 RepID=A0A5P2TUZ9_9LACO|nr:lipopolysaccharide assembly protein LapA domain-containing protein [Schleiferilactobacillus harbinensis]KRM28421.1 hypothetical protein FC91_GL001885 [Schleiferilactobacillus harbinensis DSM 16991]MBO3090326.1 DUF1049 domain-containing protein [Schleiferilactobacillus harbinensis]MCI1688556.1 lipopolysaccharide assembly protein LapA domain-containing protein [Schleiferilactobacillus harbinensis]MCI1782623.1 lipopolysaccharide assembly protein LapA domain-containing protein [Schleiferilactoba
MKKQIRLIITVALTLLIVIFAVLNVNNAAINFGFAKVQLPLVLIIIGAAFLGIVITALVSIGQQNELKKQVKDADKRVATADQAQEVAVKAAVKAENERLTAEMNAALAEKDEQIKALQRQSNTLTQQQGQMPKPAPTQEG